MGMRVRARLFNLRQWAGEQRALYRSMTPTDRSNARQYVVLLVLTGLFTGGMFIWWALMGFNPYAGVLFGPGIVPGVLVLMATYLQLARLFGRYRIMAEYGLTQWPGNRSGGRTVEF